VVTAKLFLQLLVNSVGEIRWRTLAVAVGVTVAAGGLATGDSVGLGQTSPQRAQWSKYRGGLIFPYWCFGHRMRSPPNLDSTISSLREQLKGCAAPVAGHY